MHSPVTLGLAFLALSLGTICAIQLPTSCGVAEHTESTFRIVGGQVAKLGQFPWQVYLNKTMTFQGIEIISDCGGAIVSKDYVMTAAHCVYDTDTAPDSMIKINLEAVMATVDITTRAVTEIRRKVVKVIRHENFDYEVKANDIALLKLETSLDFSVGKHIQPVCIPKPTTQLSHNCRSAGFGYQDKELTVNDDKLRSVVESIVDNVKCNDNFLFYNQTINLCVGGEKDRGTCKGDSGSPFVCLHQTEARWYQPGIISYGQPCALENVPDVVTNVAYYYDWIVKQ